MNLPRKVAAIQAKVNSHLKRRGAKYTRRYNVNVHCEQELVHNKRVSIEKPPLTDKANTVDEVAKTSI